MTHPTRTGGLDRPPRRSDALRRQHSPQHSGASSAGSGTLDEWTYSFVWRCVGNLFDQDSRASSSDVDAVFGHALERVRRSRHTVTYSERYPAWVTVVCRNAYLNYVRSRPRLLAIQESDFISSGVDVDHGIDGRLVDRAIRRAVARLPRFLQRVAHLRFVDNRTYRQIATETGKEIPTIRSYVNKSAKRLRGDRELIALLEERRR